MAETSTIIIDYSIKEVFEEKRYQPLGCTFLVLLRMTQSYAIPKNIAAAVIGARANKAILNFPSEVFRRSELFSSAMEEVVLFIGNKVQKSL